VVSVLGGRPLSREATEMLDPGTMSRRLAPHLGDGGMRVVAARVVAIAPGRRAVVAYDTAGPAGTGPALIGKVYAEPGRAGRMHALLQRIEALGIAAPRPVAHLPGLGMAVFTASAGRTLDRLEGAERRAGVVAAAAWLAGLHGSGLELERSFDLASERSSLRAWGSLVVAHHPAAAAATALLLERLEELAADLRPSCATPIHKDFHYQHCLVEGGAGGGDAPRLMVIDLDEARAGDPGFDVAHFAANLRLLGLREDTAARGAGELETAFLEAYAARTGHRLGDAHRWFHAYTCLKIARQLLQGRGPSPAPTGTELDRQLGLILAEGLR
jgi:hypothetical protein